MGDASEVVREVGVDDFRVATEQERFHLDHRLLGVAPGAIGILRWWKVGFEDRFQHQHRCCHADPIPQARCGWNAPWKKPTIEEGRHARPRLGTTGAASRKAHPSHHCWRIYTCAGSCWDGRSSGLSEVSALAS